MRPTISGILFSAAALFGAITLVLWVWRDVGTNSYGVVVFGIATGGTAVFAVAHRILYKRLLAEMRPEEATMRD